MPLVAVGHSILVIAWGVAGQRLRLRRPWRGNYFVTRDADRARSSVGAYGSGPRPQLPEDLFLPSSGPCHRNLVGAALRGGRKGSAEDYRRDGRSARSPRISKSAS